MDDKPGATSEHIEEAAAVVELRLPAPPKIGLILGSGLGEFASEIRNPLTIPSSDIPHYPRSTVPGHKGQIVYGHLEEEGRQSMPLMVFQGRIHFYESGDLGPSLFPTRLAVRLGIRALLVTNAAGGVNRSFRPGDLMLIENTLNLTFLKLPTGTGRQELLHPDLRAILLQAARNVNIELRSGTYCWLKGPSYETAAEIRMLREMGADAVGMSTVPELACAAGLGVKTAGLSLISNMGTGIGAGKLSHAEVTETAFQAKDNLTNFLRSALMTASRDLPA